MARVSKRETLRAQLALVLRMAGAKPFRWIAGTVAVSVILAGLDTLGVAAMVPLMQLTTGVSTNSGSLGIISGILGTDSVQVLLPVVAGFVAGVFIFKSLCVIAFRWWILGRTTRVSALSSVELMRRYVLAPYPEHRSRRLSELYRNINESTNQAASVLLAVVSMFSDAVVLVAIVGVLAVASPVVTLFTVVLFGFFVFGVQRLLRPRQRRIGEEIAGAGLVAWQFLMPSLEGFREVRLTSSTGRFVDGFKTARLRSARANRQMGIVSDAPRYLLEVGFVLAILGISVILFTTETREQALVILGIFAAASVRALPTMTRISANLATMRIGQAGLHIMSDAVVELDATGTYVEAPRGKDEYFGDIALKQVVFQYPDGDRPVLDGVSLVIRQNETTAFVGSSGAGKSTLLDLVLGLLEPSAGSIECGGRSITDDPAMWYRGLGVVPQDVFLVHDTMMANIAFGVPVQDIDRRRVVQVIEMARLDDLVAELPEGLETIVGERGVRLSGGQRQRLGLARALYRRPRVLVLDEATSALDNLTEHEIAETLAHLQGSMTILIVAHRLSTVRHADTLVFLKDGRIDAQGTFSDVRGLSDDFAHLVELGRLE
ncbi:ABC transporter ATP-binding protein [Rathayibacter soli]|uniref:ABC transporter ATP-binding protein n=1 Tax=Rathayibacter soli TaxID=3144168 RepID=UPI0027E57510|nr:ATP-binding cassette domain-containing protein [Glaciibacter superstes]